MLLLSEKVGSVDTSGHKISIFDAGTVSNTINTTFHATSEASRRTLTTLPQLTLHTHGLYVSPEDPADNILKQVGPGEKSLFEYPIHADHPAGIYWWHPHGHQSAALQQTGGMAGALIVEDDLSTLPPALVAIGNPLVLVLQSFNLQGWDETKTPWRSGKVLKDFVSDNLELHFADEYNEAGDFVEFDNFVLANGQFVPDLSFRANELRRIQVLNAGASGIMEVRVDGCKMHVLAFDGVYRRTGIEVLEELILLPATRCEFVLECSEAGDYVMRTERNFRNDVYLGTDPEERLNQDLMTITSAAAEGSRWEVLSELPELPAALRVDLGDVEVGKKQHIISMGNKGIKDVPSPAADHTDIEKIR